MPKNVTQIKFTIDTDVVSVFRARCEAEGVSMASVILQFMKTCQPTKIIRKTKLDSRALRKKAVMEIMTLLDDLLQRETNYRDNIPEQFQSRYETADHACEQMELAISYLDDAF